MEQTLGKRISANRKRLGLTQDQLAEQLGVTAQAVSKWENDQSCPDIATLPRLAKIFGVTTDALLGQEPVHQAEVVAESEEYPDREESGGIHLQKGDWDFRWDAGRKSTTCFGLWILTTGILYFFAKWFDWDTSLWSILWPSAIVWLGIHGLLRPRFSFFRLGCVVFGGYFLVEKLAPGLIPLSAELILPILLILWGLSLVADALRKGRISGARFYHNGRRVGKGHGLSSNFHNKENSFHCDCSFADEHRTVNSPHLVKGHVDVNFGNMELDLSGVEEVSEDCKIHADVSFGELTLRIPSRFLVELSPNSAFGHVDLVGTPDPDPVGTIHVHADASFGNIEVRYI